MVGLSFVKVLRAKTKLACYDVSTRSCLYLPMPRRSVNEVVMLAIRVSSYCFSVLSGLVV